MGTSSILSSIHRYAARVSTPAMIQRKVACSMYSLSHREGVAADVLVGVVDCNDLLLALQSIE